MGLPLLAHGGLGSWDELIFLGIAVIFIAMMGIAWVRSRTANIDNESAPVDTPANVHESESSDRFQLD